MSKEERITAQLEHIDMYRYLPPTSAVLVPWGMLPERLGGVLWRLVSVAVFLLAAWWWLRRGAPVVLSEAQRGWFFLILLAFSFETLQNGQVNTYIIAGILGTATAVVLQHWYLAAFCITAATALKVYPMAVGLLILLAYPRQFIVPLLVSIGCVFAFPFLTQSPTFVWSQYESWVQMIRDYRGAEWGQIAGGYRDLWLLFRLYIPNPDRGLYQVLQLGCAGLCAVLVYAARWQDWPRAERLRLIVMLGTSWILFCGPSTEASTFLIVGPILGWALLGLRRDNYRSLEKGLILGSFGVLWSCVLAGMFPFANAYHSLGMHPLGSGLLFVALVLHSIRELRALTPQSATRSEVRQAA